MDSPRYQVWLTDAQLSAIATASAHTASEVTNDVDEIMRTVSQNVCYIMPDMTDERMPIRVLTSRDQVAEFYNGERAYFEVVSSTHVVEVTTPWYVFYEGVAQTREVSTGRIFANTTAILFPVAADGIIGEILWGRESLVEVYQGRTRRDTSGADPLDRRQRHEQSHLRFLDALRTRNIDEAVRNWTPDAQVATRFGDGLEPIALEGVGPEEVKSRLQRLIAGFNGPIEIQVLSRIMGEWYVFCDWVMRGMGSPYSSATGKDTVELRIASIYPMTATSEMAGEIAFGLDAVPITA